MSRLQRGLGSLANTGGSLSSLGNMSRLNSTQQRMEGQSNKSFEEL
jgi:hypothetical protein